MFRDYYFSKCVMIRDCFSQCIVIRDYYFHRCIQDNLFIIIRKYCTKIMLP